MHEIMQNISFFRILRFIFPSIIMFLFFAFYTMVDGIFVSIFVGENALASINIAYPFISLSTAIGTMLATGGNAIVAKNLGEQNQQLACRNFTFILWAGLAAGFLMACLGFFFTKPIIRLLGSTENLSHDSSTYLKILALFIPCSILLSLAQSFFITAGRPRLGLFSIILSGITNAALDYLFIAIFKMGIAGAAWATGISYSLTALIFLCYFSFNKKSSLHFGKTQWSNKLLWQVSFNGSSEMVTHLSGGIITMIFNLIMLKFLGEQGVSAITVMLYTEFFFIAVYIGFSLGIAPLFSYTFGSKNTQDTKKLFHYSTIFLICTSIAMYSIAVFFSHIILGIFLNPQSSTFHIAQHGFYLFSLSFLIVGINIFTSALFTAFSNGKISALLSFLRTLMIITILNILPHLIGTQGIWLAVPIAELCTCFISLIFLYKYRMVYHY